MPISIFLSYAHKDKALQAELNEHLGALRHDERISVWWDGEILAGSEWQHAIAEKLSKADVILLLVSPAFLGSTYCYKEEMRQAIERHDRNNAMVIPILIESCYWQSTPFAKLQGLPAGMVPIASFAKRKRNEIWTEVAKAIHVSCEQWGERNGGQKVLSLDSDPQSQSKTDTPRIILSSVAVANETDIYDCFQKYGFKWPSIGIKWPQSSDIVLDNASKVISLLDSGTLQTEGLDYFVRHAPECIAGATRMRKAVAAAVPHMVDRLSQFRSRDAIQAVKNFLLYSNHQTHAFLAHLSTWNGLRPVGLGLPPVWKPFTPLADLEDVLSKLFGENDPNRIYHGRLWSISGSDTTRDGDYLYIYAPKDYIGWHMSTVDDQGIICRWFIPQVEFDLVKGALDNPEYKGLVSKEYCSEWVFAMVPVVWTASGEE